MPMHESCQVALRHAVDEAINATGINKVIRDETACMQNRLIKQFVLPHDHFCVGVRMEIDNLLRTIFSFLVEEKCRKRRFKVQAVHPLLRGEVFEDRDEERMAWIPDSERAVKAARGQHRVLVTELDEAEVTDLLGVSLGDEVCLLEVLPDVQVAI